MLIPDLLKKNDVSVTALLTNYWKKKARKQKNWPQLTITQGKRETDLFKDQYMPLLVTPEVRALATSVLDKRMWLPLATRTRFMRKALSKAIKNSGITQVILLGSGFDLHAANKVKYKKYNVQFFEIDKPHILACKEEILGAQNPPIDKNAEYIAIDYVQEDLIKALSQHGIDFSKPTFVIWEGNTFYLEKQQVIDTITKLTQNFQQLILSFDFMHQAMQDNKQELDRQSNAQCLSQTLDNFKNKNAPFKAFFAPNEIIEICQENGLELITCKTAAELAKEYEVDETPFYTAETYSLISLRKSSLLPTTDEDCSATYMSQP